MCGIMCGIGDMTGVALGREPPLVSSFALPLYPKSRQLLEI